MKEPICVHLYGAGTRDSRLRAEYIYCDHAENCTAYKEGKCFAVTGIFKTNCKIGRVERVDGGTKRSKMYSKVRCTAMDSPVYAKLSRPSSLYFALTDVGMFLDLPFVSLSVENGKLKVENPCFTSFPALIPIELVNAENILKICDFTPRAMMGGYITDYQHKIIPNFLYQLKKYAPDLYSKVIELSPKLANKTPDFVGKRAKLSTCNRDKWYRDSNGNIFHFEGDFLVCEEYRSAFSAFGAQTMQVRFLVTDDMIVKITNNEQVLDTTEFE